MEKADKIKFSFYGAAQEVTGSNYMLEFGGKVLLVDCGIFQGSRVSEEKNNEPFPYSPSKVDVVLITHAHLDHVGRLPKLARDGFKGKIFSTAPTRDLAEIMLIDSLGILRKQAAKTGEPELYNEHDVKKMMGQWEVVDYHKPFSLENFKITFLEAGHILGSAIIQIELNGTKIVFSGDIGNIPAPLVKSPEMVSNADYMVLESTYGNKEHFGAEETELRLERIIEDTVHSKGVLMIPAFSLERTQKILYQINNLVENGRIPKIPIFLDSPLSIKATDIYKKHSKHYSEDAKKILLSGDDIFNFPGLRMTLTTEESKQINQIPAPKVIIAGSGMCNGGRIVYHLRQYLSNPHNTLLIVSYQVAGCLGRQLSEGAKIVKIFGEDIVVRARIEQIDGYSAHCDKNFLYDFVRNSADTMRQVFVTHGEPDASLFFTQKIRDYLGLNAIAPKYGESFEVEL